MQHQRVRWRALMVQTSAALLVLGSCGGGGGGGTPPPVALPGPTPTPAPTPTPTPPPPVVAMPAVAAAAEASPVANLYIIVGDARGVVYRYQKGVFDPGAQVFVASASKLLTSTTILRLVERGAMRLDDNPQRFLAYWTSDPADPRSRVTLAQLLSFTSGFNTDEGTTGCIADAGTTMAACARTLYDGGLGSAPGAAFAYGPAHMQIAGAMAEAATGKNWAQLFRDEVTTPLAMPASGFFSPSVANPRLSGGGVSTVDDYARFMAALFDGRLLGNIPQLTQDRTAGLAIIYAPDVTIVSGEWHYALGNWRECDDNPFSAACGSARLVSSPGAFGWTPWVDYDRGYWAIIGMAGGFTASRESVRLEQQIQPLIASALGRP